MLHILPFLIGLTTIVANGQWGSLLVTPYNPQTPNIREDSIRLFVDSTNSLTFGDVLSPKIQSKFNPIDSVYFFTTRKNTAYWVRYRLNLSEYGGAIFIEKDKYSHKVDFFISDSLGNFVQQKAGLGYPLSEWTYSENGQHFFYIPHSRPSQLIYCRLESDFQTGLGQEYFDALGFYEAKKEIYFIAGILNGILGVMLAISFLMWIGLKQKVYLFYFLYIVNFALFMFVFQGNLILLIAGHLRFSYDFFTVPYGLMTVFLMLYLYNFIDAVKYKYCRELVTLAVGIRMAFLLFPFLVPSYGYLFRSQKIDMLFLLPGFYMVYQAFTTRSGLAFPLLGSMVAVSVAQAMHSFGLNLVGNNSGYSFATVGLMEIFIFLGTLAFRFRQMKKEKEWVLSETILMKEEANKELEKKVAERTEVIEKLYQKLKTENVKLEEENMKSVKARVGQTHLTYNEFLKIYPDDLSCNALIDNIKWGNGFLCKKCGNTKSSTVGNSCSKKCSKCTSIETLHANTVFAGMKFSINKAMYMLAISNHISSIQSTELAKELDLRLQTCWQFKKKIVERLANSNPKLQKEGSWKELIINNN